MEIVDTPNKINMTPRTGRHFGESNFGMRLAVKVPIAPAAIIPTKMFLFRAISSHAKVYIMIGNDAPKIRIEIPL